MVYDLKNDCAPLIIGPIAVGLNDRVIDRLRLFGRIIHWLVYLSADSHVPFPGGVKKRPVPTIHLESTALGYVRPAIHLNRVAVQVRYAKVPAVNLHNGSHVRCFASNTDDSLLGYPALCRTAQPKLLQRRNLNLYANWCALLNPIWRSVAKTQRSMFGERPV